MTLGGVVAAIVQVEAYIVGGVHDFFMAAT